MPNLFTEDILREEAKAVHGAGLDNKTGKELNRALNEQAAIALCLSGGGIRSGSFALGVLQALAAHPRPAKNKHVGEAQKSWLAHVNYLSTVSGGGYIGGWLSAWLFHAHEQDGGWTSVWRGLVDERDDPIKEPRQIAWLRSYSNFLTPKLGIASADSWAAVALIVRNLLLNWLIIIPLLCLALLVLKAVALVVVWISQIDARYSETLFRYFAIAAMLLLVAAVRFAVRHRPTRGDSLASQDKFLWRDLAPAAVAALFFVFAVAMGHAEKLVHDVLVANNEIRFSGLTILMGAGAAIYGVGWIVAFPKWRRDSFGDFVAWSVSGLAYGGLMATGLYLYFVHAVGGFWIFQPAQLLLLICGFPWALMSQLVAEIIFVGLTSWEENSDSDREWLARAAGWYLAVAIVWSLLMTLVFIGSKLAVDATSQVYAWLVSGGFGSVTAFLGKSRFTSAKGEAKSAAGISINILLMVVAVITVATITLAISGLLDIAIFGGSLVDSNSFTAQMTQDGYPDWPGGRGVPLAFVLAAIVGASASHFVNINRFSLHALYRNRLIRAFLGASNPARYQNAFTGFDENDNVRVYDLWPKQHSEDTWAKVGPSNWRPFHIVNMALNIVSTKKLAWQERKAEPFTVSALHAGSSCVGYRYSTEYGDKLGMSLGTAVAISGAAASPNMGYHSSPALALLLTLLNVRLGWWLGNPGPAGEQDKIYRVDGPRRAIVPLLYEMFGLTTEDWKYVYLSDGGHFENLGLYEMVRRRCRFIMISDAGCDPDFAFEDLGNAARKISLDLGVPIRFYGLTELKARAGDDTTPTSAAVPPGQTPFYAIGVIDYPAADDGGKEGVILYVKAGYRKDRIFNAGVRNYAAANPAFPHESTGDQFFSESQFESYRALGFEIMDNILMQGTALLANPAQATLEVVLDCLRGVAVSAGKP